MIKAQVGRRSARSIRPPGALVSCLREMSWVLALPTRYFLAARMVRANTTLTRPEWLPLMASEVGGTNQIWRGTVIFRSGIFMRICGRIPSSPARLARKVICSPFLIHLQQAGALATAFTSITISQRSWSKVMPCSRQSKALTMLFSSDGS